MTPSLAFDKTLERFQIKAAEIAKKSGKSESAISQFRNGHKDIGSSALIELTRALPVEAQYYFWSLCMASESGLGSKSRVA
jgi:transcriptional regulator with XRE-family HTH domain